MLYLGTAALSVGKIPVLIKPDCKFSELKALVYILHAISQILYLVIVAGI